jgi:hypothetical protein
MSEGVVPPVSRSTHNARHCECVSLRLHDRLQAHALTHIAAWRSNAAARA